MAKLVVLLEQLLLCLFKLCNLGVESDYLRFPLIFVKDHPLIQLFQTLILAFEFLILLAQRVELILNRREVRL